MHAGIFVFPKPRNNLQKPVHSLGRLGLVGRFSLLERACRAKYTRKFLSTQALAPGDTQLDDLSLFSPNWPFAERVMFKIAVPRFQSETSQTESFLVFRCKTANGSETPAAQFCSCCHSSFLKANEFHAFELAFYERPSPQDIWSVWTSQRFNLFANSMELSWGTVSHSLQANRTDNAEDSIESQVLSLMNLELMSCAMSSHLQIKWTQDHALGLLTPSPFIVTEMVRRTTQNLRLCLMRRK